MIERQEVVFGLDYRTMHASIIIRVLNERENLNRLLDILERQDFRDKEIIIVDNESTDGTLELARSRKVKVINLPRSQFSYPRALNLGAGAATGDILVFLSAHSFPLREDWLSSGLNRFSDSGVAGVYSPTLPRSNATLAERLFYWRYYFEKLRGAHVVRHASRGVLGATNCAIRKDLWLTW